jgi:hypothetical protein
MVEGGFVNSEGLSMSLTVRLPTEQQHFHVRHQVCFPVAEQVTGKRCSHVTPVHNCYEDQVRIDIRHSPPYVIFSRGCSSGEVNVRSSGEVNVRPRGGVVVGKW